MNGGKVKEQPQHPSEKHWERIKKRIYGLSDTEKCCDD